MSDRITNRFAIIQTPFHLVAKHFRLMIRLARMFLNSFFFILHSFLKELLTFKANFCGLNDPTARKGETISA